MPTIYIAGSINDLDAREVRERFAIIENRFKDLGLDVRNPARGKKISNAAIDFIPYEPNEIVHRDLSDIDNADYMVAFMHFPSIGTSMEIIYARLVRNIPVIVITSNPSVYNHYWIRSLSSKVVDSIDEAVAYIKEWYL